MKPIDVYDAEILSPERARQYLSAAEYADFLALDEDTRAARLRDLLDRPIGRLTTISQVYFRQKWAALVHRLYGSNPVTVLEVAAGDEDMIPQALARSNPGSVYITANMNQAHNARMLPKIQALSTLKIELVDDDAANIGAHVGTGVADLVAFQHGVNDVIQGILCGRAGIDTVHPDWMEVFPQMIRLVQEGVQAGTLEVHVKPIFLQLLRDLLAMLKLGGVRAMHHYPFQFDLDWGYPVELYEQMIPMVRRWLPDLEGCREIEFEGFDGQWWLFVRRAS